jgi:integrase
VHRVLREALQWAVRWELIPSNVADRVSPPTSSTEQARTYSVEQIAGVLAEADATPYGVLSRLAFHTGMRLGEILGLRWEDVDLESRRLRVEQTYGTDNVFRRPKTPKSRRTISLDEEIVRLLFDHKQHQIEHRQAIGTAYEESGLVFADSLGRPIPQYRVDYHWKQIRTRAGVPQMRFHDLRHAMASIALRRHVDIAVVSRRLGHSNVSTTLNVYRHLLPGEDEEAARVLADALTGK